MPGSSPASSSGPVVVDSLAIALDLTRQGADVVVVVDPDSAAVVPPSAGPGRLAVLVGRLEDDAVRSAAREMAAELF